MSFSSLYQAYFQSQDRFLDAWVAPGFEPDVIHSYLHNGLLLAQYYEPGQRTENDLLYQLYLRQMFRHLLDSVRDPSRSPSFRKQCLDNVHVPLFRLQQYYQTIANGEAFYHQLQCELHALHAPM